MLTSGTGDWSMDNRHFVAEGRAGGRSKMRTARSAPSRKISAFLKPPVAFIDTSNVTRYPLNWNGAPHGRKQGARFTLSEL
jgi:hypothetical protein